MKPPKPDDLIAYLYDEVDDPTRQAVDQQLEACEETRGRLEHWRATMDLLDTWVIEDKPTSEKVIRPFFASGGHRLLGLAALLALFLGMGTFLGRQWERSTSAPTLGTLPSSPKGESTATSAVSDPSPERIEALVNERLQEERQQWAARQEEIERKLILASGALTHRQVQDYVGQALQHLETQSVRNETLALFLPPQEQAAYQEKREALENVASGVVKENLRREAFTQQIIERARSRALRAH